MGSTQNPHQKAPKVATLHTKEGSLPEKRAPHPSPVIGWRCLARHNARDVSRPGWKNYSEENIFHFSDEMKKAFSDENYSDCINYFQIYLVSNDILSIGIEALSLSPMMPRQASFSDSCTLKKLYFHFLSN